MSKSLTPLTDAADDETMRFSIRHLRLKDLSKSLELQLGTYALRAYFGPWHGYACPLVAHYRALALAAQVEASLTPTP